MPRTHTPPQATETEPRPPISLQRVQSSQVAAVGYDPETKTLAVQFKSKATGETPVPVYHYPGVTIETHDEFIRADSVGTYFGAKIKPLAFKKYPAEPLPPAVEK